MKIAVIGSGLAGLTAALTLVRAGREVEIYEQADIAGGVTRGLEQDGYRWDYGQLNCEGLGEVEPMGAALNELGILQKIKVIPDHREYVFPDFELRPPAQYAGPKWRIEVLKTLFPEEATGLEGYWKDYVRFTRLITLARRLEGGSIGDQLAFYASLLPLISKKDWTAERLLNHYFRSDKLKAVFVSILADFFTPPSQFQGLGVFALNAEKVYDERIPARLADNAEMLGLFSISGGTKALTEAFVGEILKGGGRLHLNRAVSRILVSDGRVRGVVDDYGVQVLFDSVIATGGAKETLIDLVEPGALPGDFVENVKSIPLMDSVFMLHLGTDHDYPDILRSSSTYFYNSYDIEGQVRMAREGVYHEGEAGFVVHLPSRHTPGMAPGGKFAMTIYTICPDRLKDGDWERDKAYYVEKLLEYAEKRLPNLKQHIQTAIAVTPDDFRRITHLQHHAFGGIAPIMNAWKVPHQTPVDGLWFIGAQSESGGGMNSVVPSALKTAKKVLLTNTG